MKRYSANILLAPLLFVAWIAVTAQEPSGRKATAEAKKLFEHLYALGSDYTLFGHQDDLAYGVGWRGITGASDIRQVAGDYPAMYGWDLGGIELGSPNNLDGIPFSRMKEYIRMAYARGGAITVSWHARNPLNGASAWDTTHGSVSSVLPGGSRHELFRSWLDKAAVFFADLKGARGEAIPVLFRPFHEFTGNWFWWCRNTCSAEEFRQLWKFTADYLRNEKGLTQLLLVYNTADFTDAESFLLRYPGDDYADVLSFDMYQHDSRRPAAFAEEASRRMDIVCQLAKERKKIAAFAETGLEAIPDPDWWTRVLLPVLRGRSVAYVLVWRNAGYMPAEKKMHYYAPYPGQVSAADFRLFAADPAILLESDLRKKRLYQ